ncbi:unnamed protein product [Amoebophrya sp. A120]|nr:unnamed protein product [Amoebophrya sp. A120]|eukprot:GSA120T00025925001.1
MALPLMIGDLRKRDFNRTGVGKFTGRHWLGGISDGFKFLRFCGILHRDFKAENAFIQPRRGLWKKTTRPEQLAYCTDAVIGDFGMATSVARVPGEDGNSPRSGAGTADYFPWEGSDFIKRSDGQDALQLNINYDLPSVGQVILEWLCEVDTLPAPPCGDGQDSSFIREVCKPKLAECVEDEIKTGYSDFERLLMLGLRAIVKAGPGEECEPKKVTDARDSYNLALAELEMFDHQSKLAELSAKITAAQVKGKKISDAEKVKTFEKDLKTIQSDYNKQVKKRDKLENALEKEVEEFKKQQEEDYKQFAEQAEELVQKARRQDAALTEIALSMLQLNWKDRRIYSIDEMLDIMLAREEKKKEVEKLREAEEVEKKEAEAKAKQHGGVAVQDKEDDLLKSENEIEKQQDIKVADEKEEKSKTNKNTAGKNKQEKLLRQEDDDGGSHGDDADDGKNLVEHHGGVLVPKKYVEIEKYSHAAFFQAMGPIHNLDCFANHCNGALPDVSCPNVGAAIGQKVQITSEPRLPLSDCANELATLYKFRSGFNPVSSQEQFRDFDGGHFLESNITMREQDDVGFVADIQPRSRQVDVDTIIEDESKPWFAPDFRFDYWKAPKENLSREFDDLWSAIVCNLTEGDEDQATDLMVQCGQNWLTEMVKHQTLSIDTRDPDVFCDALLPFCESLDGGTLGGRRAGRSGHQDQHAFFNSPSNMSAGGFFNFPDNLKSNSQQPHRNPINPRNAIFGVAGSSSSAAAGSSRNAIDIAAAGGSSLLRQNNDKDLLANKTSSSLQNNLSSKKPGLAEVSNKEHPGGGGAPAGILKRPGHKHDESNKDQQDFDPDGLLLQHQIKHNTLPGAGVAAAGAGSSNLLVDDKKNINKLKPSKEKEVPFMGKKSNQNSVQETAAGGLLGQSGEMKKRNKGVTFNDADIYVHSQQQEHQDGPPGSKTQQGFSDSNNASGAASSRGTSNLLTSNPEATSGTDAEALKNKDKMKKQKLNPADAGEGPFGTEDKQQQEQNKKNSSSKQAGAVGSALSASSSDNVLAAMNNSKNKAAEVTAKSHQNEGKQEQPLALGGTASAKKRKIDEEQKMNKDKLTGDSLSKAAAPPPPQPAPAGPSAAAPVRDYVVKEISRIPSKELASRKPNKKEDYFIYRSGNGEMKKLFLSDIIDKKEYEFVEKNGGRAENQQGIIEIDLVTREDKNDEKLNDLRKWNRDMWTSVWRGKLQKSGDSVLSKIEDKRWGHQQFMAVRRRDVQDLAEENSNVRQVRAEGAHFSINIDEWDTLFD